MPADDVDVTHWAITTMVPENPRVLRALVALVQNVTSPSTWTMSGLLPSSACTWGVMSAVPGGTGATSMLEMPAFFQIVGYSCLTGPDAAGTSMTNTAPRLSPSP